MYAEIMQIVIHIALFSGFCYTQFADTFQEANGLVRADSHVKDSARADCAGDAGLTHPHHRRRLSPAGSTSKRSASSSSGAVISVSGQ